jgi:N-methylhydantoinase B
MATADVRWDGLEQAYVPDAGWRDRVSAAVPLHEPAAVDLDPIDYEVIRHNLWTINEEHGQTIARLSGSPTANVAMDFSPALYTETGEEVFFGPYIQHLAGGAGSAIKWILEHYGDNPGIRAGDVFLENDPWIGCNHQPDVALLAPVFVDGELFCWIANILHQYDLGGSTPGSFCPDATSVHTEPTPTPPIKLVEAGVMRRDLEAMYLRKSRLPRLVALDLRATVAGIAIATERLEELVTRYGAGTVRASIEKIITDSEAAFLRRIESIPDGTWTDTGFLEEGVVGDRAAHKMVISVTKEGQTLTFSNAGTDPQIAGSLNCTVIGWKGAIIAGLMPVFCYDQLFAVAGALRHARFEPEPGRMTSAAWPAPVSCSPGYAVVATVAQVHRLLTKMAFASEEVRGELSPGGMSSWPIAALSGVTDRDDTFASILLDEVGGGMGPYPWRDGLSVAGHDWIPLAAQPNIEQNEYFFPILYLYRKLRPDSGGAGRWRGGNTFASCYIAHGAERVTIDTITTGQGVPTGLGVFGGAPGSQTRQTLIDGAEVRTTWLAQGRIPADIDDIGGRVSLLPGKSRNNVLARGDGAFELTPCAAPGYGDPLDREPAEVTRDVLAGEVSVGTAADVYGVVLDDAHAVDEAGTDALRERQRRERIEGARASAHPVDALDRLGPDARAAALRVHEYVVATEGELACARCGYVYCERTGNYKLTALARDEEIEAAGAKMNDPSDYVDEQLVWRRYFCPGCHTLVETDVLPAGDPAHWDIRLAPAGTSR